MFKKAERKAAYLRAALCGTSGSGKTYGALLLARGLVGDEGKIAVIDTERSSACLYSDVTDFDVAELSPPYTPKRYIELIKEASKSYDVLIIDSLTHGWAGQGGVLEMHDNATKTQKNSYMAWRDVTPEHNSLVDAMLACQCHLIATMRSKTAYEIQDNNGKKAPIKVGMAPIQRDGMEYEFTLVWDVMVDSHVAYASKDRTRLWNNRNELITIEHGRELREWLEKGGKIEIDEVKEKLLTVASKDDVTSYWRSLGILQSNPQYKAVLALFQEAKARLDATVSETLAA